MPDKLREMQQLFLIEAAKYHVFPIDDRTAERFNPLTTGRVRRSRDRVVRWPLSCMIEDRPAFML